MNLKILLILSFGHLVTDIYQGALPAILPLIKAKLSLSYTMAGIVLMTANFSSSICSPCSDISPTVRKRPCFCHWVV